jgi:hypothetical protein
MEDLGIRVYVRLLEAVARLKDEEGQVGAEYVGIVAFVVAVAGALLAFREQIASAIGNTVSSIIESIGG